MARHGYHGTSVARIARAVGISNSALYQHYDNLEAVLVAATELLGENSAQARLGHQLLAYWASGRTSGSSPRRGRMPWSD